MTSRIRITLIQGEDAQVSIGNSANGSVDGPHHLPYVGRGSGFLEYEVDDTHSILIQPFGAPVGQIGGKADANPESPAERTARISLEKAASTKAPRPEGFLPSLPPKK
jgi:hypothetical protein